MGPDWAAATRTILLIFDLSSSFYFVQRAFFKGPGRSRFAADKEPPVARFSDDVVTVPCEKHVHVACRSRLEIVGKDTGHKGGMMYECYPNGSKPVTPHIGHFVLNSVIH